MIKKISIAIVGFFLGTIIGVMILPNIFLRTQVIGFLPYWLLGKADKDYTKYITTLAYFGLTVGPDGSLVKLANQQEEEPGWYALRSGKIDKFFRVAKQNHIKLSLVVASGDEEAIGQLMNDPIIHAKNLMKDVTPIMKKYGFSDLNLDIESVKEASEEARGHFVSFVQEVDSEMKKNNLGTITVDASPIVVIKKYLIDLTRVGGVADNIVLMTYDYHYPGSFVTGPVAPIGGAGIEAEFDIKTALEVAIKIIPSYQIFLGVPLYGYEWETIGDKPRSAVVPASGLIASNRRVEDLISSCASCSAQFDAEAEESYIVYKDQETRTYHQIFYPDRASSEKKAQLANQYKLGGIALWALGYEGKNILEPFYKD